MPARTLSPRRDFHSLSIKDLLEARDAYHTHLAYLENVVATAIGRYRFASTDRGATDPSARYRRGAATPRTLANSTVTELSWPCVMVFVKEWIEPKEFAKRYDEIVPPRLYLPDGRVVPTCVIYAERKASSSTPAQNLRFPGTFLGGGFPALADVQGRQHLSTLGCLVSDGDSVFVLTDRHVAGEAGRTLYTLVQGEREQIGVSHKRQVGHIAFASAYPGLGGTRLRSNLDAGLVQVTDATRWTSQVYGVGEFEELVDVTVDNLSLDLIGKPVRAYGAASGLMLGEIQAMYYRYRSVGGLDYVADFLIAPRKGNRGALARGGNSGCIWFLEKPSEPGETRARRRPGEPDHRLAPFALHWGAQCIDDDGVGDPTEYALATALSTVCRELDVDILRDLNTGLPQTWGKVGHYKIGQAACGLPTVAKLRTFMKKNLDRVSFEDADIEDIQTALKKTKFVALSDVPDIIWKGTEAKRGRESPNHFADMDERSAAFNGRTLLEVCANAANVDVDTWNQFYASLDVDKTHRGLLPFRVWQLFDVMVDALGQPNVARYLCAAGVLAHYIGDACQPLHTSRLHNGDPDTGLGSGVHSDYETKMLDKYAADLNAGVNAKIGGASISSIQDGRDAAVATVALMRRSIAAIPPQDLIDAWLDDDGTSRATRLWNRFGKKTVSRFVDGSAVLASIWQGAWNAGGGSSLPVSKLGAVNKQTLRAIYKDRSFAPSVYLTMMSIQNGVLVIEENP